MMAMNAHDELAARLRIRAAKQDREGDMELMRQAADLIEQQDRDIAALKDDIEAQTRIAKEATEKLAARAPAAATTDAVTRLRHALYQIAHWPDGGNAYGQEKIKRFAIGILDGEPPTAAANAVAPLTDEQRAILSRLLHMLESGRAFNGIGHDNATIYAESLRAVLSQTPSAVAADAEARCTCSGLGPCEKRADGSCRLTGAAPPDQFAQDRNMAAQPNERAAFEAKFPVPGGVNWDGAKYVVRDDYMNSYPVERFGGQWEAWQARAAAPTPTVAADAAYSTPFTTEKLAVFARSGAVRVCAISDVECSRGCGADACKREMLSSYLWRDTGPLETGESDGHQDL
jgi:hypothetical protein